MDAGDADLVLAGRFVDEEELVGVVAAHRKAPLFAHAQPEMVTVALDDDVAAGCAVDGFSCASTISRNLSSTFP
jgi:hypothetical protein